MKQPAASDAPFDVRLIFWIGNHDATAEIVFPPSGVQTNKELHKLADICCSKNHQFPF